MAQRNLKRPTRTQSSGRRRFWTHSTDEELLDVRLCDLGLRLKDSVLEKRVLHLMGELRGRGIQFQPHFWLSEEWFTPDGIPGIAIPFYLAHPRLMRLEQRQMLEVEGGTATWCLRILRHEAGHALDNAYRLSRRKSWQEVFGKPSQPYPEQYQPRPNSKSFVQHLDMWYAQAHPAEDFAETFAVWLKPRSNWRRQYQGWPALRKLEYVDWLMGEIARKTPVVRRRTRIDSLPTIKRTLREHYAERKERYGVGNASILDQDLLRLFSNEGRHARNLSAALFLRRNRSSLRQLIGEWTTQHQYTIDQALDELINRCRTLKLRLRYSERETRRHALVMLTVQTMNYLLARNHRVVL